MVLDREICVNLNDSPALCILAEALTLHGGERTFVELSMPFIPAEALAVPDLVARLICLVDLCLTGTGSAARAAVTAGACKLRVLCVLIKHWLASITLTSKTTSTTDFGHSMHEVISAPAHSVRVKGRCSRAATN